MAGIKDIAKRAGTSVAAVSRALNDSGYVSSELRERIEEAARALDYQPNAGARTLRSGRSNLVGVLLPTLEVEFFARLAHRLEQKLFAEGYQALICSTAENTAHEGAYIQTLAAKQIDGLLVAAVGEDESKYGVLTERGVPIVAIDRHLKQTPSTSIGSDHELGGQLAARHVIALGHRHVAIIGAPRHSEPVRLRAKGMCDGFALEGLTVPACHFGAEHTVSACEVMARRILEDDRKLTAILATSDIAAVGAIRAAKSLGLKVPENLSVTGFDDSPIATYVWPELTTIRQPLDDLAEKAVDLLIAQIKTGEGRSQEEYTLPVTLIERSSTAPPG